MTITPRPLPHDLDDYYQATSGFGPLADQWSDKPHRLLYDLIAAMLWNQKMEETELIVLTKQERNNFFAALRKRT